MASNWMNSRQTKFGTYAAVYTLVILAIVVVANVLANRYDKSYDSTKNKQFSLSEQTQKVVKGLKQDVTLTYFGTEDSFKAGRDLLDQYSNLSPKLHTNYIAPDKKPTVAKSAGYRGTDSPIIVEAGSHREAAKALTEEEVSGALIRAVKTADRNVCFVSGYGEHSIDDSDRNGFSLDKKLLERDNYKARTVTLKPAADTSKPLAIGQSAPGAVEVPSDCSVLVLGGPQQDYPQVVVDAIKTYVEKGGRAEFLLDNVVPLGRQDVASENPLLTALLAGWGVTAEKNLILERDIGEVVGFGPEIPVLTQFESHQITAPLASKWVAFPLVRSLDVKSSATATIDKLAQTSEDALGVTEIGAGGAIDQKKAKHGPFTLAAAARLSGGQGRFVVVGTSLYATNGFVGVSQFYNRDLFVNSINWLASDEDLISIRPKTTEDQPFNLTPGRQNTIFWLSVVIFPLGTVMFGLATWWKRR